MRIANSPSKDLALTNCIIIHPDDCVPSTTKYVILDEKYVFTVKFDSSIGKGSLGTGLFHRRWANFSLNQDVRIRTFDPILDDGGNCYLDSIKLSVDYFKKGIQTKDPLDSGIMSEIFRNCFLTQILTLGQTVAMDFQGIDITLNVAALELVNMEDVRKSTGVSAQQSSVLASKEGLNVGNKPPSFRGVLTQQTSIYFEKNPESSIILVGSARSNHQTNRIIQPNFKFEDLGIGGLDKEFSAIFRRAFASRIYPPALVEKLGVQHVKGILLFGPPGTGKTLIAREIGKMLNAKEPKIVNGPEILNKYVGQSEENIRNLFKDAEADNKQFGDSSPLHIIIFDELDAICKQRGSQNSGTGVGDSVVNQLLSKMDGVEQLNNILIIGMTNRKDMIDEALLRPGRLEVHMEIGLPDEKGRIQILKIHTQKMSKNGMLDADVNFDTLASSTKNFTGAEIFGLVKAASSYAFNRYVKVGTLAAVNVDEAAANLKVSMQDFELALKDISPAFGSVEGAFDRCALNGIIHYNTEIQKILEEGKMLVQQVKNSDRTPLLSVLFHGPLGSGKTSLAATLAKYAEFPFSKLISPEELVGKSEMQKMEFIAKTFSDASKSALSLIVVDNLEGLMEYVPIGPRFSNNILQTLLILFRKNPPKGRKMLVLATSSDKACLNQLGILDKFHSKIHVPIIRDLESVMACIRDQGSFEESDIDRIAQALQPFSHSVAISVKDLLMMIEGAKQDVRDPVRRFIDRFDEFILASSSPV